MKILCYTTIIFLTCISSTNDIEAKSKTASALSSIEKSWNSRTEIITSFQKQIKKTAWRYRSAIRRGQHSYLEKSLSSIWPTHRPSSSARPLLLPGQDPRGERIGEAR